MIFLKFRKMLRSNSLTPSKFAGFASVLLILLSWPIPMFFDTFKIQLFGIPFVYFYIIIMSPVLLLFITSWAINFADQLDRRQLETEND